MDECLSQVSKGDISEETAKVYQTRLRQLSRYLDGRSTLDLDIGDVQSFLNELAELGLSGSTISTAKSAIRKLYVYIHMHADKEAELRVGLLKELNTYTDSIPDREPLTPEEFDRLLEAAKDRRNRLMILIGGETGARNESLRVIKTEDVDLENNKIELRNTKTGGTYVAPISGEVALAVQRWLGKGHDSYCAGSASEFLFPKKSGGKLEHNEQFCEIVNQVAKRADMQEVIYEREVTPAERRNGVNAEKVQYNKITPHTLRRTFSFRLELAGLDIEERSAALDHMDISTTQQYYTFARREKLEAIEAALRTH
jgi:integrase/recombinase XerD